MFRRRRIQSAADPPGHSAHAVSRLQPVEDVYLLFLNRPPDDVPADDGGATVVPAASLHHPELPQPDAQRLFDRVTPPPRPTPRRAGLPVRSHRRTRQRGIELVAARHRLRGGD